MVDFGFAFNASNFSDWVLRVEILSSEESDCEGHGRKRKRGDEATHCDDSGCDDLDCSRVVKVETLHISSAILAVKSPFFYKLFNNGMRESHQKHLTLRINACEEEPLMDLLKFLYTNTLSATTALDLLDVLMVADKFEVVSCMRYCSLLLKELPMSLDSAHFYLKLPSSVLMAEAIQPLTDAAKQYLAPIYKLQDEAMVLPLPAVERVLYSDDVQVVSEDEVFDFMLKWARAHYPKPEEYREILNKRFVPMVRFPHMTYWKLMEVLVCPDLDHEQVSKLVREALFVRAGLPTITSRRLTKRIYKYLPIKVVQLQFPDWPRCVVYFDLKKEECANVSRPHRLYSQPFHLGGKGFALIAKCKKDRHFGLYLYMGRGKNTSILDYEFEVKRKPSEEFQSKYKVDNITLTRGVMNGKENLFGIPWTEFMSDGNDYFIDGILHIRAELTLKN